MPQVILTVMLMVISMITNSQMQKEPKTYEAASWPTKLLSHPEKMSSNPPPSATQANAELQDVKQAVLHRTAKDENDINYWNAGAPAYRWNQIIAKLVAQKQEVQLRMPSAWMNVAIYDATVLAWKDKLKFKRSRPADKTIRSKKMIATPTTYSYPCEHSVTAAAAANVLAYFFPAKADSILLMAHTAAQSRIKAGVQFPSDVEAGWQLGEAVAKEIIEQAKNDGSAKSWNGQVNKDPKKWTGNYPVGINLVAFTPLVIDSAAQFRPQPPPDFAADMQEMKNFKQTFRTAAQAYYWASTGEVWTELAGQKIFEYRLEDNAPAASRIYAVLSSSYHDAAIAIMDAKYAYWGIRPNQYDSTYKPLISTPPFPGYPSGHAAGAGTAAAVMEYFFPADKEQFRQLAQACADSRFYAGIHFRTDNEVGLTMGKAMGEWIVRKWMNEQ